MLKRIRALRPRDARMLLYLAILAGLAAWRFLPRKWEPTTFLETAHYAISSTATPEQTAAMARAAETLYEAYHELFSTVPGYEPDHPKLKVYLYKDRDELRYINRGLGWAEAFYRKPASHAYYAANESNPFHWMLHEVVHQLNKEVAHLSLEHWLEEGLAEYLGTSRIEDGRLRFGTIDPYTYPVWWLSSMAKEGDLAKDLAEGSVIPLRAILTNQGGPAMSTHVNLYYLHWWTLAHYVFEKHPTVAKELIIRGGTLEAFEELVGRVELIEPLWHAHVLRIKAARHNPHFEATGELPPQSAQP